MNKDEEIKAVAETLIFFHECLEEGTGSIDQTMRILGEIYAKHGIKPIDFCARALNVYMVGLGSYAAIDKEHEDDAHRMLLGVSVTMAHLLCCLREVVIYKSETDNLNDTPNTKQDQPHNTKKNP